MNDDTDDVSLGLPPVRFREVERTRQAAFPRCRGACDQGRRVCVTPEACDPQPTPATRNRRLPKPRPKSVGALIGLLVFAVLRLIH